MPAFCSYVKLPHRTFVSGKVGMDPAPVDLPLPCRCVLVFVCFTDSVQPLATTLCFTATETNTQLRLVTALNVSLNLLFSLATVTFSEQVLVAEPSTL